MEEGLFNTLLGILGIIGIGIATIAFLVVVWYVLQVIAYWRIFNKFGEPGWKSLIPVYRTYMQYKATWDSKMVLVAIVLIVLSFLDQVEAAPNVAAVLTVIAAIAGIGVVVVDIIGKHKLSQAFGHGVGFTLGLVFLDPIFKLILGFGGSRYIGHQNTGRNTLQ